MDANLKARNSFRLRGRSKTDNGTRMWGTTGVEPHMDDGPASGGSCLGLGDGSLT